MPRKPTRKTGRPFKCPPGVTYEKDRAEPVSVAAAKRALAFFRTQPPGKRFSALAALWRAVFGQERQQPFLQVYAVEHLKSLPHPVRAAIRQELDGAITIELDPECRRAMVTMLKRCTEYERIPRARRNRTRPMPPVQL